MKYKDLDVVHQASLQALGWISQLSERHAAVDFLVVIVC